MKLVIFIIHDQTLAITLCWIYIGWYCNRLCVNIHTLTADMLGKAKCLSIDRVSPKAPLSLATTTSVAGGCYSYHSYPNQCSQWVNDGLSLHPTIAGTHLIKFSAMKGWRFVSCWIVQHQSLSSGSIGELPPPPLQKIISSISSS